MSSSTRGTWIEIKMIKCVQSGLKSSSTRGTWIEITTRFSHTTHMTVVLHTGDVD